MGYFGSKDKLNSLKIQGDNQGQAFTIYISSSNIPCYFVS